jgi:hypothetical protein
MFEQRFGRRPMTCRTYLEADVVVELFVLNGDAA